MGAGGGIDVDSLAHDWWAVMVRGLLAILFGVVTLSAPGISLTVLVLLFGAWAFVDGVFAIVSAFRRAARSDRWWLLFLEGVAGVVVGIATLLWPGLTA